MSRRGAARAHACLESDRVCKHEVGAAHGCALGQREQRGEHRRAGMKHHAAHVRVVVIQQVAGLTIGERRVEQPQLEIAAEHRRLRPAPRFLQHAHQLVQRRMFAAPRARSPASRARRGALRWPLYD
jgi:hypothetical protein